MRNGRFTEIGKVGKPRGLEGLVRFLPGESFTEGLLNHLRICYVENGRGDLIPARIESVSVESKRNRDLFFVKFDMITGRSDAESVIDCAVYVEADLLQETDTEVDIEKTITGYFVLYEDEKFGTVDSVIENPAHPIMKVSRKGASFLIPFVDEYVEKIDREKEVVHARQLHQLFDLI